MKISETISTGILLFGGILVLKAMGGIKGITDIFSGIGDLFGGGGGSGGGGGYDPSQTAEDILTHTENIEERYRALSVEAQELALREANIQIAEDILKSSKEFGYIDFMADWFGWVPGVGDLLTGATETVEDRITDTKDESMTRYYEDILASYDKPVAIPQPEIATSVYQELHGMPRLVETEQGTSIIRVSGR